MTHIKTILTARGLLGMIGIAVLLASTGCGQLLSPQAGDQDAKLPSYEVEVFASDVMIEIDPTKPFAETAPFKVGVSCTGKNLPPDCDQNVPNWTSRTPPGADFLTVKFGDPTLPQTTVTVIVDVQKYLLAFGSEQSALGQHWFQIGVFPGSIPENTRLSGKRDFTITIDTPNQPPVRQEQPPDDPRLTAVPNPMGFVIRGTDAPEAVDSGKLIYSGPLANLVEAVITGAGRSKFTLLSPSTPYIFKAGQSSVSFSVRFQTDLLDPSGYDANLIFTTDNGAVISVPLHGYRNPF
jgi:hypothetical protein